MTSPDDPRVANRDDALEVLDELIEEADDDGTIWRLRALKALRDAIEAEIL